MTQPASTDDIPPAPSGATLTTLENGLTIIVREDHSAPVVSAQAWCMAGSVHEGKWLGAGLSHVLEHMLFKGTTTRPGSRIDQEVQEAGGYMNAYTCFDRTVYHIDVPNTGAVVGHGYPVRHHAERHPARGGTGQGKARHPSRNGHERGRPGRRSSRRLFETAYTRSPYRFTVIGYPDIFNELKPEDISDYYREKYAPNNVFYVVAGDMNARTRCRPDSRRLRRIKAQPLAPVPAARGTQANRAARAHRRSAHRTRPSRISPGTFPICAIRMSPSWMCWPRCSGRAAARGSTRRCARNRASSPRRRLDLQPGQPGLFGMSALLDAGQIRRRPATPCWRKSRR